MLEGGIYHKQTTPAPEDMDVMDHTLNVVAHGAAHPDEVKKIKQNMRKWSKETLYEFGDVLRQAHGFEDPQDRYDIMTLAHHKGNTLTGLENKTRAIFNRTHGKEVGQISARDKYTGPKLSTADQQWKDYMKEVGAVTKDYGRTLKGYEKQIAAYEKKYEHHKNKSTKHDADAADRGRETAVAPELPAKAPTEEAEATQAEKLLGEKREAAAKKETPWWHSEDVNESRTYSSMEFTLIRMLGKPLLMM